MKLIELYEMPNTPEWFYLYSRNVSLNDNVFCLNHYINDKYKIYKLLITAPMSYISGVDIRPLVIG